MDIVDKARQWCKTVRTKPTPLSEAIPMVAKLCDENESLRNQLAECQKEVLRLSEIADALLNHCEKDNGECMTCSTIVCPHKEPLHFHHDGCPACAIEAMGEKE
jgi:hypothetical protein